MKGQLCSAMVDKDTYIRLWSGETSDISLLSEMVQLFMGGDNMVDVTSTFKH